MVVDVAPLYPGRDDRLVVSCFVVFIFVLSVLIFSTELEPPLTLNPRVVLSIGIDPSGSDGVGGIVVVEFSKVF